MTGVDCYPYFRTEEGYSFEFISYGPKGAIKKIAGFKPIGKKLFNFSFGDLDIISGKLQDNITSNNMDAAKVMNTLGAILMDFCCYNSGAIIYVEGFTRSRTRFYQMNINKYRKHIHKLFEIYGLSDGEWEKIKKGKNYEAFMGRKFTAFDN